MNVLVLTPVFPHSRSPLEGLFNEEQARAFVRKGIEVTVVVCKPWLPNRVARLWDRYSGLADLPKVEKHGSIPVYFARYFQMPACWWVHQTAASCARALMRILSGPSLEAKFNIIQVHDAWPVGLATTRVANVLNLPFVVTMHIEDDPRLYKGERRARLYREMIGRASGLVVVGRPLEKFVRGLVSDEASRRLRVIPNGVDLDAVDAAVRKVDGTEDGWGRIVSVCNLWPVKGIDQNLMALKYLDEMGVRWRSYTIVGDGPEKPRLTKLANELGIADRVFFLGRLPHREAIKEIAKANIFSLPSWQEAFGVVYLEAMACGKPVIGCQGQGAEDVVQHEKTGLLVAPRDRFDLALALRKLLDNPEYSRRLGGAAVRHAREFTWERNAEEYLSLYEEILSNRLPSS